MRENKAYGFPQMKCFQRLSLDQLPTNERTQTYPSTLPHSPPTFPRKSDGWPFLPQTWSTCPSVVFMPTACGHRP